MKFDYPTSKPDPRKPQAFIDQDGDLFIIDQMHSDPTSVCLTYDNLVVRYSEEEVAEALESATHVFYEGDKITITF